ncbi:MAG: type I-B CRISPR-associated protein Cas5b [Atribacterota bacterium]
MKLTLFNLYADYGHYKKFYTTSSPLTFSIPTGTALFGLIGAILGFPKEVYNKKLIEAETEISVVIENPIKKVRFGSNKINTSSGSISTMHKVSPKPMIQEYIKNAKYRIYFSCKDKDMLKKLEQLLKNKKTVYTPAMGISECIASISYVDTLDYEVIKNNNEYIQVISVVPYDQDNIDIKFEPGKKYQRERIPILMDENRQVQTYKDIVYETEGKSIMTKPDIYWKLENGENIITF